MIAIDAWARPVALLVSGMTMGAVLAGFTTRPGGVPLAAMAALPFLLAALTGVATTTTA